MKSVYINDFMKFIGEPIKDTFFLREFTHTWNNGGNTYTTVVISDKTGNHSARMWVEHASDNEESLIGTVVTIEGNVRMYDGNPSLNVVSITPAPESEIDNTDYAYSLSKEKFNEYVTLLYKYINMVEDPGYLALLRTVFTAGRLKVYGNYPAGLSVHHNFNGALLVHTLEVIETAVRFAETYTNFSEVKNYKGNINMDLLIAGAALHDIGKLNEYKPFPSEQITKRGHLVGHLVDGAITVAMFNQQLGELAIDDTSDLQHIILSSHGDTSFVKPMTIEAQIVANADLMSARTDSIGTGIHSHDLKYPSNHQDFVYNNIASQYYYRGEGFKK